MDKKLKRVLAEFVLGERKELSLYGNPYTLALVYEATLASRELMIVLESGDPDLVNQALLRKRKAVKMFENRTGRRWEV